MSTIKVKIYGTLAKIPGHKRFLAFFNHVVENGGVSTGEFQHRLETWIYSYKYIMHTRFVSLHLFITITDKNVPNLGHIQTIVKSKQSIECELLRTYIRYYKLYYETNTTNHMV